MVIREGNTSDVRRRPRFSLDPQLPALLGLIATGLVALVFYASSSANFVRVLGSGIIFAAASSVSGGFLGFLFGIPRAHVGDLLGVRPVDGRGIREVPSYTPNTNLEQISDWLTKIIIGVSLTQLGTIRIGAARLFANMGQSLGGRPHSATFAGALTLYFAIVGFLTGWLSTKLYLGRALNHADERALDAFVEAAIAEQEGKSDEAGELRREALDLLAVAAPAASTYEGLRHNLARSPERTAAMEEVIGSVGRLTELDSLDPDAVRDLYRTGSEGDRAVAIGLMEARPALADLSTVEETVNRPRSPFEQFHGLKLAGIMLAAGRLGGEEQLRLAAIVSEAVDKGRIDSGRDRRRLAEELLRRLESRTQEKDGPQQEEESGAREA